MLLSVRFALVVPYKRGLSARPSTRERITRVAFDTTIPRDVGLAMEI